jgi:transaldolase/transaldolase/glucose-6-phosphate isomerase
LAPIEIIDEPAARLNDDAMKASAALGRFAEVGIDLDAATRQLESDGVRKFSKPFDILMAALKEKRSTSIQTSAH